MSDTPAFQPFLQGIEGFLDQYDIVFRISKEDEGGLHSLVITPVPKYENVQQPIYVPVRVTGTVEEIATILENPDRGMKQLTKQIVSMQLEPVEKGTEPKAKRKYNKRTDTDVSVQNGPTTNATILNESTSVDKTTPEKEKEPAPWEDDPKPTGIVPDEPPANIQMPPISNVPAEPKDMTSVPAEKRGIFNRETADELRTELEKPASVPEGISEKFDLWRKLSQNITLECRSKMGVDWTDVQSMWKQLMAIYKGFDKKEQEDFKERLSSLHTMIKAAQERDKAALADAQTQNA